MTYAGYMATIKDLDMEFVKGDIKDYKKVYKALEGVDAVVNFAAESHNDRAIENPYIFMETNALGVQVLMQACVDRGGIRFHHISTCEVFGDLELDSQDSFEESYAYRPRTPYNASKASGNHVVKAYFHTYDLPVTISHCANNYGPYQFPEKLIPLFTTKALNGEKLPIYKSSENKREWIHVDDHNRAVDMILQNGVLGEEYNIGTGVEKSVEEITEIILKATGQNDDLKEYIEDRKSHDKRYLLNCSKIQNELGWKPLIDFEDGIAATIQWYKENADWCEQVTSKEHQDFQKNYYKNLK
jgi:dTDP-glucose 4,6-dehydratase